MAVFSSTSVAGLVMMSCLFFCYFQTPQAAAGTGSRSSFLSPSYYSSLSRTDDGYTSVSVSGGFPFAGRTVYTVYVSVNGYISMGTSPSATSPNLPGTTNIVSPYGADINIRSTGTVRYTLFSSTTSQISTVSSFIRTETGNSFYGTRMMVVQWLRVPLYSSSFSYSTSSFQAALITDGLTSYAVFIYDCGGMGWSGATIGWSGSSRSNYEESFYSGSSSSSIGCAYSSAYSAVVYQLGTSSSSSNCYSYQFSCDNGRCVPESYECDGANDCYDNSDEDHCVTGAVVAIAVGVTVPLLCLCCSIGIPVCIIIAILASRRRRATMEHVVTTSTAQPVGTVLTTVQQQQSLAQPLIKTQQFGGSTNILPPPYPEEHAQAGDEKMGMPQQQPYPSQIQAGNQPGVPYPPQIQPGNPQQPATAQYPPQIQPGNP